MDLVTLLLLAVGLSADAFAVSICKGLAMPKITWKECLIVGVWFGGFQGIMPFIGYVLGVQFEKYINEIAPWVAFALLALIGGDMIKEALSDEPEEETATLKVQEMLLLAIATSIDALAVGITFACVPVTMLAGASAMIMYHISHFRGGGEYRTCLWNKVQEQGGICWRLDSGAIGY